MRRSRRGRQLLLSDLEDDAAYYGHLGDLGDLGDADGIGDFRPPRRRRTFRRLLAARLVRVRRAARRLTDRAAS